VELALEPLPEPGRHRPAPRPEPGHEGEGARDARRLGLAARTPLEVSLQLAPLFGLERVHRAQRQERARRFASELAPGLAPDRLDHARLHSALRNAGREAANLARFPYHGPPVAEDPKKAGGVAVEMIQVTKRYPRVLANDRVDFSARVGEVHALVGENGAGK